MTKQEKKRQVSLITKKINENEIIYLTNIQGLNSVEIANLRRSCFNRMIQLNVVKNTFVKKSNGVV